jgi:hypothetical protein
MTRGDYRVPGAIAELKDEAFVEQAAQPTATAGKRIVSQAQA